MIVLKDGMFQILLEQTSFSYCKIIFHPLQMVLAFLCSSFSYLKFRVNSATFCRCYSFYWLGGEGCNDTRLWKAQVFKIDIQSKNKTL